MFGLNWNIKLEKIYLLHKPKIVFVFQIFMCLNPMLIEYYTHNMINTLVLLCKICMVPFSYDPWHIPFQVLRCLSNTTINVWKNRLCHLCCSMVNCFRGVIIFFSLKHFDSLSKPYAKMLSLDVIMCEAISQYA
jgi:hypothetical protein